MREVPGISSHCTFSISITSMVTHRFHLLFPASSQNSAAGHHTFDTYPHELVLVVREGSSSVIMLDTESVSIPIVIIGPAV
jgi:hypothetical protein